VEKSEGKYIKAERDGKYAPTIKGDSSEEEMERMDFPMILIFFFVGLVVVAALFWIMRKGGNRE
jgi:hypothetical protein